MEVQQLYAEYQQAPASRARDCAVARTSRSSACGCSGMGQREAPRGVGIIKPTGPRRVGDSTAVHRAHRRFMSK
jgi:hypothetical protein